MKIESILYSPLVFLPIDALAHPGHEAGTLLAGIPASFLSSLLPLLGLGAAFFALRVYRRRRAERADD